MTLRTLVRGVSSRLYPKLKKLGVKTTGIELAFPEGTAVESLPAPEEGGFGRDLVLLPDGTELILQNGTLRAGRHDEERRAYAVQKAWYEVHKTSRLLQGPGLAKTIPPAAGQEVAKETA